MTDAEAAWVREHAWTKAMRKTHASTPAVLTMCPCEYGPCGNCSAGHHGALDQPSADSHQGRQTTIYDFLDTNPATEEGDKS